MALNGDKVVVGIEVDAKTAPAVKELEKLTASLGRAQAKSQELAATQTKSSVIAQNAIAATRQKFEQQRAAHTEWINTQKAAAAAAIGLAGTIAGVAIAADKLSQRSLALRDVQGALRISIDKARVASNGLIGDYDLQTAAVTALRFGIVKTDADFAKLVRTATTLARTTGQDSTQAVADLTTALSRQSPQILDNLGLQVNVEQANRRYAASLGKSAAALTDAEKKQAFFNAAMEDADKKMAGLTVTTDGWAVSLQQAKTALGNLVDDVVRLPENIGELADEITRTIGVEEEATVAGEVLGRVLLGTVTLGASEAYFALKHFNEEAKIFGDRFGSVGFTGLKNIGTKGALKAAEGQAAGEGVMAGLANSLVVGQNALEKYEAAHKKTAKAIREDSEALREFNRMAAEARNLPGVMRAGSDTRDFESMRVSAHNAGVANDAINSGALSRDGKTPEQREAERLKRLEGARAAAAEAAKKRHEEEMARQEELLRKQEQVGAAIGSSLASVTASVLAAGNLSAAGFKKVLAEWGKAESIRLAALAVSEGVQAIVSAAFFNFPQAALHGAAAAQAAAGAVVVAGMTGALGGFGSLSKKVSGGFDGSAFGGGAGQPAANGPPSVSNSQTDTTPLSPQEDAQQSSTMGGGSASSNVVNIGTLQVLGTVDEMSAKKIAKAITSANRRSGSLR